MLLSICPHIAQREPFRRELTELFESSTRLGIPAFKKRMMELAHSLGIPSGSTGQLQYGGDPKSPAEVRLYFRCPDCTKEKLSGESAEN